MSSLTRWELKSRVVSIAESNFAVTTVDPKLMWKRKDKEGQTDLEKLKQLAADGWELVSVTPLVTCPASSQPFELLYTFKRPLP
jgi:hypothetical protein